MNFKTDNCGFSLFNKSMAQNVLCVHRTEEFMSMDHAMKDFEKVRLQTWHWKNKNLNLTCEEKLFLAFFVLSQK